jgi:hypothetical protein
MAMLPRRRDQRGDLAGKPVSYRKMLYGNAFVVYA